MDHRHLCAKLDVMISKHMSRNKRYLVIYKLAADVLIYSKHLGPRVYVKLSIFYFQRDERFQSPQYLSELLTMNT